MMKILFVGHGLFALPFRLLAENSVTSLAASSESPISPPTRYKLIALAMFSFTVSTAASKKGFIGSLRVFAGLHTCHIARRLYS